MIADLTWCRFIFQRQNCELECEDGGERHRCEEAAVDGIEPVVETLAQNWSSMDRKGQYERVVCHQRTYAQLGWSCCQDGPQRNLCEGLEMPGLEYNFTGKKWRKTNGLAHTHNGSKSTGGRTWLLGKCTNSQLMQTICRNLSRTTRVGCILLKTVEAGNSFRNVERALYRWFRVPQGPRCVRHDWDGCRCYLVDKEKKRDGKVWRALGTPLSVSNHL